MDVRLESLISLDDEQLLFTVSTLAAQERRATVRLIGALAELERRRLYLAQGCASLFTYCTQVLHLSEDAAYNRMVVARAVLTFPVILTRLDAGVLLDKLRIRAALNEADFLRLRLVVGRQSGLAGNLAHFRLGQLSQRK